VERILNDWTEPGDLLEVLIRWGWVTAHGRWQVSREENEAIARRHFLELIGEGKLQVADEIFHSRILVAINSAEPEEVDRAWFKEVAAFWHNVFPDAHITINQTVAEGDWVAEYLTYRGTHSAELWGVPPTGRQVVGTVTYIYRIADGRIAEVWGSWDRLMVLEQLGISPPLA